MLIKIFDTVFDIRHLSSMEIMGVLSDEYFAMKSDGKYFQNYCVRCIMDDDSCFEIPTFSFSSTRAVYHGVLELKKLSDFELVYFIQRTSPKELFYDVCYDMEYPLENVLYAMIYDTEVDNLYSVGIHFFDQSVIFSEQMTYSKCEKYLKNLSLLSIKNRDYTSGFSKLVLK